MGTSAKSSMTRSEVIPFRFDQHWGSQHCETGSFPDSALQTWLPWPKRLTSAALRSDTHSVALQLLERVEDSFNPLGLLITLRIWGRWALYRLIPLFRIFPNFILVLVLAPNQQGEIGTFEGDLSPIWGPIQRPSWPVGYRAEEEVQLLHREELIGRPNWHHSPPPKPPTPPAIHHDHHRHLHHRPDNTIDHQPNHAVHQTDCRRIRAPPHRTPVPPRCELRNHKTSFVPRTTSSVVGTKRSALDSPWIPPSPGQGSEDRPHRPLCSHA